MLKPITIIGGGLAGLTLGIGLRQRGIPVVVWEAGRYPRHRVCGEFISGHGQQSLSRLGLHEIFFASGARLATTAAFFSARFDSPTKILPEPAWCLSRYSMDKMLADEFCKLGGDLRENSRWPQKIFGDGIVRASGRRAQPIAGGWRWFGLKVHARHARLSADLELHFVPAGYVGLCQLKDNEVNVCGLFRSRIALPDLMRNWRDWLKGSEKSALHERLAEADFEADSFCSAAGLSLAPQKAATHAECCVGDALTMIPPLTGNGMSMAFESAELAIEPLAAFSAGEITWPEAGQKIAALCDDCFRTRLRCANWLQRGFFQPGIRDSLLFVGSRFPRLWAKLFFCTR